MIVSPGWLSAHLSDADIRVVDVRSYLGEPERGRSEYYDRHIPGAVFLDLETDLSSQASGGGRHPLPDWGRFVATLNASGIANDHQVIIYDQTHGSIAARLWWMLRHIGHERVSVLDGGWAAWTEGGYPDTPETPPVVPAQLVPTLRPDDTVNRNDIAKRPEAFSLIDARAAERFLGEVEPIDPVAGHIPGAINIPHESLTAGGRMLPTESLRETLTAAPNSVAYCGSGVTACYLILAHSVAGLEEPRLYVGSWSDWSTAGMATALGPA